VVGLRRGEGGMGLWSYTGHKSWSLLNTETVCGSNGYLVKADNGTAMAEKSGESDTKYYFTRDKTRIPVN